MIFLMIILAVIWTFFFMFTLYVLSQVVSLLGIYHILYERGGKESFPKKLYELLKCNAALSLPLLFTFNYLFQTTLTAVNVKTAFYLSLPITVSTLLSIRLLANPTEITQPSIIKFFQNTKERSDIIKLHKERILSFFYAFISASIILLILIFNYHAFANESFNDLKTPMLSCIEIAVAFFAYLLALFCGTLIGEIILKIKPPIEMIP
jgi:hypothetical protein